jgi:hypothetical protein
MAETFTPDNLIAGDEPKLVRAAAEVALGQTWSRGELVGKLKVTGKWQIVDLDGIAGFSDVGIASEAIDTTAGEANTFVFVEGEFNKNAIFVSYGEDADDWIDELAGHSIYLRTPVTTEGVG